MLETLREIDGLILNFSSQNKVLLNLTIGFIMLGVALELNVRDFRKLRTNPTPVILGILSQFIVLPLLTFLLVWLLKAWITPTIGLGMILVASCPGGNVSNFISNLAKGNIALSVSLTAFSTIACLILTPLNFMFWGNLFMQLSLEAGQDELVRPLEIDPYHVFETIALILGLPILLGIIIQNQFRKFTRKAVPHVKRLSILAFSVMVVVIFVSNYDFFLEYILFIFVIVLIHNTLALTAGYTIGRIGRLEERDRKTLAIETGIQNSGLALALLFNPNIFSTDLAIGGMTFIAAWWGVWHIIAGLLIAGYWSGFRIR